MKVYVVGLGPGTPSQMTGRARAALDACEVIAGYTLYVELVRPDYPEKEVIATPMRGEVERCRLALETAASGRSVAMVCSGDPGVYGMAGLMFELGREFPAVSIEVIPGVTAACSGAAVLGAPLACDFAVISLSDLLTDWPLIERRLDAAASACLAICLYNPASRKRAGHLRRACDIMLRHLPPETVCGLARNVGRDGEEGCLLTLAALRDTPADMFTTVFVGTPATRNIDGKMVTPRGYRRPDAP